MWKKAAAGGGVAVIGIVSVTVSIPNAVLTAAAMTITLAITIFVTWGVASTRGRRFDPEVYQRQTRPDEQPAPAVTVGPPIRAITTGHDEEPDTIDLSEEAQR